MSLAQAPELVVAITVAMTVAAVVMFGRWWCWWYECFCVEFPWPVGYHCHNLRAVAVRIVVTVVASAAAVATSVRAYIHIIPPRNIAHGGIHRWNPALFERCNLHRFLFVNHSCASNFSCHACLMPGTTRGVPDAQFRARLEAAEDRAPAANKVVHACVKNIGLHQLHVCV